MTDTIPALSFGWTIVYTEDPVAASAFYADTFGLVPEFTGPGGTYAQMDTGTTKLAFAAYTLGASNFPGGVASPDPRTPAHVELALVSPGVDAAHARALSAGCTELAPPADQPHGQRVSWIRDPFGTLLELATPM